MASVELQGTKFSLQILPNESDGGHFANVSVTIENEYVRYSEKSARFTLDELETMIFSLYRLLAGAYGNEYSVGAENAGIAFDLYPYTENGNAVDRALRRERDCVLAIRLLMRSKTQGFLGGVYSVLLHRKEIEKFAGELREEFDSAYSKFFKTDGKYCLAGVSPFGYKGCNYWYLDRTGTVKAGEYVIARMGRHNTEQALYVDSVRFFDDETLPIDLTKTREILRKPTKEELLKLIK